MMPAACAAAAAAAGRVSGAAELQRASAAAPAAAALQRLRAAASRRCCPLPAWPRNSSCAAGAALRRLRGCSAPRQLLPRWRLPRPPRRRLAPGTGCTRRPRDSSQAFIARAAAVLRRLRARCPQTSLRAAPETRACGCRGRLCRPPQLGAALALRARLPAAPAAAYPEAGSGRCMAHHAAPATRRARWSRPRHRPDAQHGWYAPGVSSAAAREAVQPAARTPQPRRLAPPRDAAAAPRRGQPARRCAAARAGSRGAALRRRCTALQRSLALAHGLAPAASLLRLSRLGADDDAARRVKPAATRSAARGPLLGRR